MVHAAKRPRHALRLDKALEGVRAARVVGSLVASSAAIGTHDGTFHCDEALACAMLKLLPAFAEHAVVRTRDEAVLAQCEPVVDVGGVYDPSAQRYDHHQRGFTHTLDELGFGTKLSSAGLVWRHHGKEVLRAIGSTLDAPPEDAAIDVLYKKVYKDFVEHIDGIDNGIEAADGAPNYAVTTTLSRRVGRLNAPWNESASAEEVNALFKHAMELTVRARTARPPARARAPASSERAPACACSVRLCVRRCALQGVELGECVLGLLAEWWPARQLVVQALDEAEARAAASGAAADEASIVVLPHFCPWPAHLLELEAERGCVGRSVYVLFQDSKGGWRVQAVPQAEGSFSSRLPLPEPWRGVRGAQLSKLLGLEGCVFVHAAGFIGGHETKEGALTMARAALAHARDARQQ